MMQADTQWLTNPSVFQVNRLDAHSDHICFASPAECVQGKTSLRQPLDGVWRFAWSRSPAQRPADFWRDGFDDSGFGLIEVPGHIETQGHGQLQYINFLYPWDGHAQLLPPEIDWDNTSVGSYVTEFDLAPGMKDKRVCVSFQGVEQAFFVWLNGHFAGYSEDSFTPSDFDLTPYLRETGNRLCVEVWQRSSAAWIEDQDFFRFSGIFRSVFLYAKPEAHLADLWLQAGLEEDNRTGTLSVRLLLEGEASAIHCRISHPLQGVLLDGPLELHPEGKYLRSQSLRFENILPWHHESPALYRVTLTLHTADSAVSEVIPYDIGFRRFERKDGLMLLNGQRLLLNGVNRHEWSPDRGRAIRQEDMDAAMTVFRRNNINAVRTCHYPNQTAWYHLCDQNGIYMIDETNLESHGSWQRGEGGVDASWNVPGSLPEWRECVVDRARSMFERDKNHAAILFWSCGNESYAGEDIMAMADFFREQDPSRLVHYEGVFHNRAFHDISDVESRMYASPQDVRAYLEGRQEYGPFLLCEYMHDMGNSLGGMESYIRLSEEFPQYQGGFIWDYMDQALWRTDALGRRVLGYGGDFGDRQSDYAFSGDGIVFADGTEKPAMQEVRYWYASPEQRAAHDDANRQAMASARLPELKGASPLRIVHGDGAFGVHGKDFKALFSYPEGGPVSLVCGGTEWLWRAPRPAYWRAPTENDLGCGFPWRSAVWSAAETWQRCDDVQILRDDETEARIRYTYTAPAVPGLRTDVIYTVSGKGYMDISVHYYGEAGRPQLPLLGLRFATPVPVEKTAWLGLSGETYPDRKKGGVFGWHQEQPHIPGYLVPQECGCHTDTWAVSLHMSGGAQLTLEKNSAPFAFSALPYTPWQLEQAAHREELPEPVRTVVTVCGAMRGVGGIDSFGTDVEEAYHVSAEQDIEFSFRVRLHS